MIVEFAQKIIDPAEIFTMREISVEDLGKASDKLANAGTMSIINRQESGPFDYFVVLSGEKTYEVVQMGSFVKCTCPSFTAGHAICKHIAYCIPAYCRTCFKRYATVLGGQCDMCGPGELLPVGARFKCAKYFGKRAVMEVVSVDEKKAVCVDVTLPENKDRPRPTWDFNRNALDFYRNQGALQIVEKELAIEE